MKFLISKVFALMKIIGFSIFSTFSNEDKSSIPISGISSIQRDHIDFGHASELIFAIMIS